MGWAGFNCSIPHKRTVLSHLDDLAVSAQIIGAVNCVVNRENGLIGENTDGQGFLTSLRTKVEPSDQAVVVFGAGGAARAIAVEVALAGAASVTVVNRDGGRGEELVHLLLEQTLASAVLVPWSSTFRVPEAASIVVNATSIGLFPDVDARLDIEEDSLLAHMTVAGVIPNPPRTRLIREAEARGCATLDGLGMLVNQATIGIKQWTGVDVEPTVMRQTLEVLFSS
jgi:shikimate dehydrogenase